MSMHTADFVQDFLRSSREFEKLIAPVDANHFFAQHWDKDPLFIDREQPGRYTDLFSIEDFDRVLYQSKPAPPLIRVIQNQKEMPPDCYTGPRGELKVNQLYKAFDEGYTVILNELHRSWEPLARFCRGLQDFLSHTVVANAYLSPCYSTGLDAHYDSHDVFVLQLVGSKTWNVYPAPEAVPLVHSFQPTIRKAHLPRPIHSIPLNAGDTMYIPRGFVHDAATQESTSLHLTIGVYPSQWCDLLRQAIVALSLKDQCFRRALPAGFLSHEDAPAYLLRGLQERLKLLLENASAAEAVRLLKDELIRNSPPLPDGHFSQLDRRGGIGLESVVEKRPGIVCQVIRHPASVAIQFSGNTITATHQYEPALKFIDAASGTFEVEALPELDDSRKLQLTRRLIRGGLLKVIELS